MRKINFLHANLSLLCKVCRVLARMEIIMKKITGIYLSGTGNTKHCTEKLLGLLNPTAKSYPIENPDAVQAIAQNRQLL